MIIKFRLDHTHYAVKDHIDVPTFVQITSKHLGVEIHDFDPKQPTEVLCDDTSFRLLVDHLCAVTGVLLEATVYELKPTRIIEAVRR